MATRSDLEAAERAMRELLEANGLREPDEVQHWDHSVCLMWHDTKTAVVVDVDDPGHE